MDKEQFLDALLRLLSAESVAMIDPGPSQPYGSGPAKALATVLDICSGLGIRTENRGGKIAWAEIGEGEEIVGILGHLDVVPIGEGWKHNPRGEVDGDRLYGRGAVDDKGPVMAALFAMKELQDARVPLKRRVRLIFGQNEETGDWEDIEYYKSHEQLPVFGFTPDAEFPAIYGEKRILHYILSLPLEKSGLRSAAGGDAPNMVPAWARAELPNGRLFQAEGRAAHASKPEKGLNAIGVLMRQIAGSGEDCPLADFYQKHLAGGFGGEGLGCDFSDEQSGGLTVNPGLLRTEKENIVLTLDIRCPVTFTGEQVGSVIEKTCKPWGIDVRCVEDQPPVYLDKNGPVIQTLLAAYRETTGDGSEPELIGGGTYARSMPGIVAFGPLFPGREATEHQKDEYILLEDLWKAEEIYRKAIFRLANL